jgi:hypothetical protein
MLKKDTGIYLQKHINDAAQVPNDNSDDGYISIRQFAGDLENDILLKSLPLLI